MNEADAGFPGAAPAGVAEVPPQPAEADTTAPGQQAEAPTERAGEAQPAEQAPDPVVAAFAAPDNIRELREADLARRMFSPQKSLADAIPDPDPLEAGDALEQHKAIAAELREMAADAGIGTLDIPEFKAAAREARTATPEQRAGWRGQASAALRQQYGKEAEAVLNDARRLVARDPRAGMVLDAMGVGDHPRVVMKLAELARRERLAGRL